MSNPRGPRWTPSKECRSASAPLCTRLERARDWHGGSPRRAERPRNEDSRPDDATPGPGGWPPSDRMGQEPADKTGASCPEKASLMTGNRLQDVDPDRARIREHDHGPRVNPCAAAGTLGRHLAREFSAPVGILDVERWSWEQ